ncbi:MAG: PspA/IM30 family protein [Hyphomicrobiaceae bacterium]
MQSNRVCVGVKMAEPLVLRVKRLVSGSLNGLVDALENANTEMVMREAVREIDNAVDDVREELGRVVASRHQTRRTIDKTREKLAELAQQAELAIGQGRDDLAEAAIGRQIDLEADLPKLDLRLGELAAKQTELEGYVSALNARKREMENDIAAFVAAREAASAVNGMIDPEVNVGAAAERKADRAQQAFDRAMNGTSGVPGVSRADRDTAAKLGELERLTRSGKVADRLASLKAARRAV